MGVGIITEQGYPFGEGQNLGYSPIKEEEINKKPKQEDKEPISNEGWE